MRQVWMQARQAFTFKDLHHEAGDVFQVVPIVAVQLQVKRLAQPARAPKPVIAVAPEQTPPAKRRGRPPKAKPVETPPEPERQPEPAPIVETPPTVDPPSTED